jgi:hypothetical protein
MLRNVTLLIWPIEGLFVLFSPQRRLGDFIAGTRLVDTVPTNAELILKEIETKPLDRQIILTLVLSIAVLIVYAIILDPRIWIG